MGMFDWYKPVPDLECPNCKNVLSGWQGKNADCGLFIWQQGVAYPVGQDADEEWCISEEQREKIRLPRKFDIYTTCDNCPDYRITAECKTEAEIWKETVIAQTEKIQKLPRKWFGK